MAERRNQSSEQWIGNTLVGTLLLLIFLLLGEPLRAQIVLEAQPGYPKGTVLLTPQGFPSGNEDSAAKASLVRLEQSGELGFWGARDSRIGEQPKLPVSASLIQQGLVQVRQGRLPSSAREVLSLAGGPYPVGTRLEEAGGSLRVSGVAAVPWITGIIGDSTVLKLQRLQDLGADQFPTLVLNARAGVDAARWVETAQRAFGLTYAAAPLSAYLSQATRYMENGRASLQRRMAVMALILLLLALVTRLNLIWHRRRERLRVERMLGRSEREFFTAWFRLSLSCWLYGALAAPVLALLLGSTGRLSLPGSSALLTWLGVCGAGLGLTALMGLSLRRVPLGRAGVEQRQSWTQWALPALMTCLLAVSIPVLGTGAARLWLGQGAVVRGLGADTLVAMTLPTARSAPSVAACPEEIVCVPVGWTNISLWTQELQLGDSDWSSLGRFRPQDAAVLNLKLQKGRWPRSGKRETVISTAALRQIQQKSPSFGIGSELRQGYRVVGTVDVPPHDTASLFADMRFYEAAIFIPWAAPGLETTTLSVEDLFLSPLGTSALMLREVSPSRQTRIQAQLRTAPGGNALEFYRPAQYAAALTATTQTSLLWLAGLLALGLTLAAGTYVAALQLVLFRRAQEISVWRILGLSVAGVRTRLGRPLLTAVGSAALTGLILALLLERASLALTAALGAVVGLLLLACCILGLRMMTQRLKNLAVDEAYREAL